MESLLLHSALAILHAHMLIGFVGLGRMGANMARRLKERERQIVVVYDCNREIAESLAKELGAKAATDVSEVSRLADVIFTVVSDDQAMHEIFFGARNLFEPEVTGKLFINCATISPSVHCEVAKKGELIGASVLEAPMASSIPQARNGTLYMMLSGSKEAYEEALPLLGDLTASNEYVGEHGKASTLKALVNMVMNINTAGLAEGLGLAEAAKLDLQMVKRVFSQTGAHSRVLETDGDDMITREHSVFFSAAHAAKDSGIALALAEKEGLDLPLLAASKQQFDRMVERGLGEIDKSGVSELTFLNRSVR
jgi:3-hydroxyisobutyrate dehydrogenase